MTTRDRLIAKDAAIDLAGVWEFRLDPDSRGFREHWERQSFSDTVRLPGTLDENGIGVPNLDQEYLGGLSRKVTFAGSAWFSREVSLPAGWDGAELLLILERVHWVSQVWVDGHEIGSNDSLSTPHHYRLGVIPGSKFRLTIRVDNVPTVPIGRIGHSLTDWTQTNWNGIVGKIRIEPSDKESTTISLRATSDGLLVSGTSRGTQLSISFDGPTQISSIKIDLTAGQPYSFSIPTPGVAMWSDDQPNLYRVQVADNGNVFERTIGFRSFEAAGKYFKLNGVPVFLRGTLECCVFPITGYPPTDLESWEFVMNRAKEFGLNHLRFHSYCPPEAAFAAADNAGILLQVELPLWTAGWATSSDAQLMAYCRREGFRILKEYGHHPSFVMMTLGNEIAFFGEEPQVDELLEDLRSAHPDRLYNFSAQGTYLSSACDYYVQADNGKPGLENRPLRGSTWFGVGSRFDRDQPNSLVTCDEAATQFDRPVLSHEVGEWAVFPDVYNSASYTGVLEARNFKKIARMLYANGMSQQAQDFVRASGKLSAALYKEEIETLLRTRELAGYQLLGLTDFPGQGTATIGMLDVFWENKGFVSAEEFRDFCGSTVPLLCLEKFVWKTSETLMGSARVFHSGTSKELALNWCLVDSAGKVLRSGTLGSRCVGANATTEFQTLNVAMEGLVAPAKYVLRLEALGFASNSWPIWLFPAKVPDSEPLEMLVSKFYDSSVRDALSCGQDVWLRLDPKTLWSSIPGRFAPAFWSPIHFKEQVGTMGTLIQAEHPLFSEFVTDGYTEWHWWDVLTSSRAMVLNDLPAEFRPVLQVIDRYERNHKLGTIWEAVVGEGRLLVTAIDFEAKPESPVMRQLEHSIRTYAGSDRFEPKSRLRFQELDAAMRREP